MKASMVRTSGVKGGMAQGKVAEDVVRAMQVLGRNLNLL